MMIFNSVKGSLNEETGRELQLPYLSFWEYKHTQTARHTHWPKYWNSRISTRSVSKAQGGPEQQGSLCMPGKTSLPEQLEQHVTSDQRWSVWARPKWSWDMQLGAHLCTVSSSPTPTTQSTVHAHFKVPIHYAHCYSAMFIHISMSLSTTDSEWFVNLCNIEHQSKMTFFLPCLQAMFAGILFCSFK